MNSVADHPDNFEVPVSCAKRLTDFRGKGSSVASISSNCSSVNSQCFDFVPSKNLVLIYLQFYGCVPCWNAKFKVKVKLHLCFF
jgi:hypothetical protein